MVILQLLNYSSVTLVKVFGQTTIIYENVFQHLSENLLNTCKLRVVTSCRFYILIQPLFSLLFEQNKTLHIHQHSLPLINLWISLRSVFTGVLLHHLRTSSASDGQVGSNNLRQFKHFSVNSRSQWCFNNVVDL